MADLRYTPMGRTALRLIVWWAVGVPALLMIVAAVLGVWPLAFLSASLLVVALLVAQVVRRVAVEVELRSGLLVWSSLSGQGEVPLESVTGLRKWRWFTDVLAVELGDDDNNNNTDKVLVAPGKGLLVLVSELRRQRTDLPEPNIGRMNQLRERLPGRSHATLG